MNSYLTISGEGEILFKEKGSKFFGFAKRVESSEEIQIYLEL